MKKTLIVLVALSGFALAFTGCTSNHYGQGPYVPQNVMVNDLENRESVVLLDKRVQYSVTCTGIQETRLPDARLQIAVNLRNRENRRIQVQANCEFKDTQGFVVDATPFQNVILNENGQEGVTFVSMNDKAVRYTVRVREAH
jgi:uncharacterized protein DUF1425